MKGKGHTARCINLRDRIIEKLKTSTTILTERYGLTAPFQDKWGHSTRELRDLLNKQDVLNELADHFGIPEEIQQETKVRKNDPEPNEPLAFVQGGSDFRCPHCNHGHDLEWNTEYGDALGGEYIIQCRNEAGCNRTFKIYVDTSTRYTVG